MTEASGTRSGTGEVMVGIIGAGPAGLVLARLLSLAGVSCVILESRSRNYCETRVRAGQLDRNSIELLERIGAAERFRRESMRHDGLVLRFQGLSHRVDFVKATGASTAIYGQQDLVKDLIELNLASGVPILFNVTDVKIDGLESDRPSILYIDETGAQQVLRCSLVAGCDGFHGPSRSYIPNQRVFERDYPFAMLGIVADAPPPALEGIYCFSDSGFALFTMRSPQVSRHMLQVPADTVADDWSDEEIWNALRERIAGPDGLMLTDGPIRLKAVAPLRSFVVEPMQYGNLFLAGDAAHIVPPTGAKGMNLAIADVVVLAAAIKQFANNGSSDALEAYTDNCLDRVWSVQRFSWWMTQLLFLYPEEYRFERSLQRAEQRLIVASPTSTRALAEFYVGRHPLLAGSLPEV